MSLLQSIVHGVEEGRARVLVRLVPLAIAVAAVALFYDFSVYRGLSDAQSMDNAQLARQLARGNGFTTEFIRPYALSQLAAHTASQAVLTGTSPDLFPPARFPAGAPRLLPDTYNAPAYPCLLAAWFDLLRPAFDEPERALSARHMYAGDRPIPWLNQIFLLLTAGLVFILGRRLFDERVAWLALVAFLASDIVWQYSVTALSTSLLMFLVTAMLLAVVEIFSAGERREEESEAPAWPAWAAVVVLALLLGFACLTRLHLLVLLLPLGFFLALAPRAHFLFVPVVILVVLAMTIPWFWHMDAVSGSPFGSNAPLLHYGVDEFTGNRIYCSLQPPNYERLFRNAAGKESWGFGWHLGHAWELLGTSPLVVLFVASLLHHFRRSRAQAFRWFILGTLLCLVVANNLGVANPGPVDAWNIVVLLFPGMLVIGAAFFFILVDRLDFEVRVLNTALAVGLLALTAVPLAQSIFRAGGYYNYPPYAPPYFHVFGRNTHPDEWITSDLPWALAWYGDRGALWLPDAVKDFETIHDEYCPSSMILITPVTLGLPFEDLVNGEEKEWLPFILSQNAPAAFPLPVRTGIKGIDYIIWTTRS